MKPSERVKQIFSDKKYNVSPDAYIQCILEFLDESYDAKDDNAFTRGTDLVELLKQIEKQKFDWGNFTARQVRMDLRKKFREVFPTCEANEGLEERVFGKEFTQ